MGSELYTDWTLRRKIECPLPPKIFGNKPNTGCEISKSKNYERRTFISFLQSFPLRENKLSTNYTDWCRLKLIN